MGDNFIEFSTLTEKAGEGKAASLGRGIGEQAVLEMVQRCPSAGSLLAKVSSNTEISDTERSVLLPITQAACQRLDAENAKHPFAQLTAAQRSAQVQQMLGATLLSSSQALIEQYGDEVMEDGERGEEIGKKIGLLMLEVCPNYLLEVGRDELARKRQAAAAPVPKAKAAPARKAPAKAKATPLKSGGKR